MPAPNEILPHQLMRLIGLPTRPEIVDVCTDEDFEADPHLIAGAWRHSHDDLQGLLRRLDGKVAVIVCQKGKKLSQGVAAWLAAKGVAAEYLAGGIYAWRDQPGALRVPASALPGTHLWVTRHRPKIDRIACPWLIRRFINAEAEIMYVSPSTVTDVAKKFDAIPFDTEGARFAHQGENCSFDVMLDAFNLSAPALERMADVIRAADTNRHDMHPAAAGLLALSVGLSRQYKDDQAHLKAGLSLYDALYAWARDGYEEEHKTTANAGERG